MARCYTDPLWSPAPPLYHYGMSDPILFPAPANPESTKMIISANVRRLMAERSVTQTDLARAMGLPQPSISKRLRGVVAWDAEDLDRLVEAFGVPIEGLVLPRLDSNQQPADYMQPQVAPVIILRPRPVQRLASAR